MRVFLLFSLLLTATALPGLGQVSTLMGSQPPASLASGQSQYCMLTRSPASPLQLDYGQNEVPAVVDAQLAQAAAKVRTMQSVVAALNYLSARGWEFIGVTTATPESRPPEMKGFSVKSINTTYLYESNYLLRRRIP